jgi:hypothetical protein
MVQFPKSIMLGYIGPVSDVVSDCFLGEGSKSASVTTFLSSAFMDSNRSIYLLPIVPGVCMDVYFPLVIHFSYL